MKAEPIEIGFLPGHEPKAVEGETPGESLTVPMRWRHDYAWFSRSPLPAHHEWESHSGGHHCKRCGAGDLIGFVDCDKAAVERAQIKFRLAPMYNEAKP